MNGYITLDYELGMGRYTGTPEKCLIEPMKHLEEMVDKYGVKMNVFVDAAYLIQLRKLKENYPQLQVDYETISNHIKQLDAAGHAIQLHLHPQWIYSDYDGGRWRLDMDHYKLSDMPIEEQKKLIIEGTELLNSLTTKPVKAFRAGGYSIENFSQLYDTFLFVGIEIDSSVFRGNKAKGKFNNFDYRKVPLKTSWRFLRSIKEEDNSGQMIEYPISTIVVQAIRYLINKHSNHHIHDNISESRIKWGDGKPIGAPVGRIKQIIRKIEMLLGEKAIRASIEESVNLEKVYHYSRKHYQGEDFVIIGHPKAISQYNIAVLERFIQNHQEVHFSVF